MKPIAVTKAKEVSQTKPRLGQGRAGLRCIVKTSMSTPINKPIVQLMRTPIEQPKNPSK